MKIIVAIVISVSGMGDDAEKDKLIVVMIKDMEIVNF